MVGASVANVDEETANPQNRILRRKRGIGRLPVDSKELIFCSIATTPASLAEAASSPRENSSTFGKSNTGGALDGEYKASSATAAVRSILQRQRTAVSFGDLPAEHESNT